ncbi:MAG: hypothetical protein ACXU8A_12610 [Burkholderiaceae bacterium]
MTFEFKGTAAIHKIGIMGNEVVGALTATLWLVDGLGFHGLSNEAASIAIDELIVENRLDLISIYDTTDLTKDMAELQHAKQLKDLIEAAVTAVEADKNLPDDIKVKPTDKVDNPFK